MARALADDVSWLTSEPDAIENALVDLWRTAARDGPVTRPLLSNLIVICSDAHDTSPPFARDNLERALAVARRHPSRVVLVRHVPGVDLACGPSEIRAGVMHYGEADIRYGIEVIDLRAACADRSIPSILRSLVRGEVPTAIWWIGQVSLSTPAEITRLARQVVYDSREWRDFSAGAAVVRALARAPSLDLVDLNWRRLQPLLSALAHAVESHAEAPITTVRSMHIRHRTGLAGSAHLLAAWIRQRLELTRQAEAIAEDDLGDGLIQVELHGDAWVTHAVLLSDRVEWQTTAGGRAHIRRVAPEHEADAIAEELRALARDSSLTVALQAL